MDHLPVFLNVKGQRALVVGNGTLAARKADLLLRAGCDLTVVAPEPNSDLAHLLQQEKVRHKTGRLGADDLDDCVIAFGASADDVINQELYDLAKAARIPVNVSDNPTLCDFVMPALVDRSPLLIAIGSGGTTPLLTRMLKARFETSIPAS
ncbi:MAG: siroheme synthase, partial [Gammaproteobacteria bacterium]